MFTFFFVIYLFLNDLFGACSSSTLVINVVEVGSNNTVTLPCHVSSSTTLTRWTYLAGLTGTSYMNDQYGTCTVSPSDNFLGYKYSNKCNSTIHQISLPNADANINNRIVACRDAVQLDGSGSTWMIKVVAGLVDIPMYISSSPDARPAPPSSDVKADLVKPDINGSNDLYAQVQKTKIKDAAVNGYEIVDVNTVNNKKSDMKKTPQVKATTNESKRSNINQDGLNYADLVFNGSQTVEKKKIEVYEPTPYDVVDFPKKAEPLPDSDDDDNK